MFKALKERFLCWLYDICYTHRVRKVTPYDDVYLCLLCQQEKRNRDATHLERIYQQLGVNQ